MLEYEDKFIVQSCSEKFQKMGSPGTAELNRLKTLVKRKNSNYRFYFAVPGLFIVLKIFRVTVNITLSMWKSPWLLASVFLWNAKIIESPLA